MFSNKIEGVSIERLSDKEKVELPMVDFLKMLIAELPIADKVNDEIKFKHGEVYRISSLQVIEMDEQDSKDGNDDALPLENNENESNSSNTSNFP